MVADPEEVDGQAVAAEKYDHSHDAPRTQLEPVLEPEPADERFYEFVIWKDNCR